jgi:Xylanase inhibitor N-terminal
MNSLFFIPFGCPFRNNKKSLHYAFVDLGTPSQTFLVALDTGSGLFWVPCNCKQCAPSSDPSYGVCFIIYFSIHIETHFISIFSSFHANQINYTNGVILNFVLWFTIAKMLHLLICPN